MKPDLVAIGHIINETIEFPDRTIGPVLGSPVAYSAVVAARLGVKTGIVTRIGTDMPSHLLEPFSEAGVDMLGMKVEGEKSTETRLVYEESGSKMLLYPQRAPDIFFGDIPKDYLEAKIFFVCPINYEVPIETVKALADLGTTLATDLGGYGGAAASSHPSTPEDREALRELVGCFHIVKASTEDCRHLFGAKSEEEIARLFVEWGAEIGMVTLGEKGAFAATKEQEFRVPTFPANVVDVTGAGDAYDAGFLVEYLRTKDAWKSALFASATASLMIEGTGGVLASRMPTTSEVNERIAKGDFK